MRAVDQCSVLGVEERPGVLGIKVVDGLLVDDGVGEGIVVEARRSGFEAGLGLAQRALGAAGDASWGVGLHGRPEEMQDRRPS